MRGVRRISSAPLRKRARNGAETLQASRAARPEDWRCRSSCHDGHTLTTSLNARTLRALLTLIALTCLAAAATAQLAHAAGSLMSAQNAVVRKITGTYGPATLTTRA